MYHDPLSLSEQKIHGLSLSQIVSQCKSGQLAPPEIMLAFAKKTLLAHKSTNCVTDIMFEEALRIPSVANWPHGTDSEASGEFARDRPLMGVPVSLKGNLIFRRHLNSSHVRS